MHSLKDCKKCADAKPCPECGAKLCDEHKKGSECTTCWLPISPKKEPPGPPEL